MSNRSKIEWTDATWNPVSGCTPASPGCAHCYAARLAKRLPGAHAGGKPFSEVVCHPERLAVPLHWRKPRRIFVCSMGDLFHDDVPFPFIDRVWAAMLLTPHHTYQVLTKRPARMLEYLSSSDLYDRVLWAAAFPRNERPVLTGIGISNPATLPPRWIWLGVTAEDQQRADERIPLLLQCPAAVRFVSVEPMLGAIDFEYIGNALFDRAKAVRHRQYGSSCLNEEQAEATTAYPELSWVICGGESGPGARPMHPDWARSLRDQCKAAGVPFLFKRWGEWAPAEETNPFPWTNGTLMASVRVGKREAGRLLDGVMHDGYPEVQP